MGAADNGNIPGQILITTDGQNDIVYNFGMQHGNVNFYKISVL